MSYEIIANVGRDPSLLIRLNLKTNEYSKNIPTICRDQSYTTKKHPQNFKVSRHNYY